MFELSRLAQSEILRYRTMLINGFFIYPLWGMVINFYQPEINDPLWLRVAVSLIPLGSFIWSFFTKQNKIEFLERSLVWGGFVFILHSNWTLVEGGAHPIQYSGYIILISTMINIYPSKRSSVLVGASTILFALGIPFIDHAWHIPQLFVPFGIISTVFPSLFANFTRLDHLRNLEKIEKQQSVLFANLSEGLVVHAENGTIEAINPSAPKILGISYQQMMDSSSEGFFWKLTDETGTPLRPDEVPSVIAANRKKPVKNQIVGVTTGTGEFRWLNVNAIPYRLQDQELKVAVTFSDVTAMKKSQDLIAQQQSQLVASSKMSALGEMAAGVAHEINNPLAIISGKVFQIRRDHANQADSQKLPEHLDKISSTITRIQKIIKGLQTFARGGEHDPFFLVSVKSIVEEVLSFSNEKIMKQNVTVQLNIPDDLKVECRTAQLSQVMLNLIHNACDAVSEEKDRWIRIEAKTWGQRAQILISDSGPGIPKDIQAKIMQPFFTTKEVGEGTGLGLSISKGIIDSHQGRFELIQAANPTTFLIDLPIHQNQESPSGKVG